MAGFRHVQLFAPVHGVFRVGELVQLAGVDGVRQTSRRRNAEGFQPAADVARHTVEGEAAAADDIAGGVLVQLARRACQPAVHHIAGRVVDDKRRDAAPFALPRRPDAFGVHTGLDDREVDALRPEVSSSGGLQHREAPVHDRQGRQTEDFDAVGVRLPRGQAGQRRRHDKGAMPRRDAPPRQIPSVPLDPAGCR